MVCSPPSLLRWTSLALPQASYLAVVNVYDEFGRLNIYNSTATVDFPAFAIFCNLILGTATKLACIATSSRRYDPGILLGGSCSATMNAACHRPIADAMAYGKPVMWGVVDETNGEESETGVGNCCFNNFEAGTPVKGRRYAGLKG